MISGWIILDKESGLFSRTAGAKIAGMFGVKKFGHLGTLDPMATGVLPIALGDATKMIPFIEEVSDDIKEYLFSVQFGLTTDTLDITGREIGRTGIIPTPDRVRSVLPKLVGEISQVPPMYSAIHIGGERAYALARAGHSVEIKPRQVKIYELEFLGIVCDSWQFRVRCSTGTYVRSLGSDIAKMCGTIGVVDMIRRTYTNGFDIKNSVKLDFLEKMVNNGGDFKEYLKPIDLGLGDIPVINLDGNAADLYRHGGFVETGGTSGLCRVFS